MKKKKELSEPLTEAEVEEVKERIERFIKRMDRVIAYAERLQRKKIALSGGTPYATAPIRKNRKNAP
jgi:hypothetical protein